jgi:hypothetical protein
MRFVPKPVMYYLQRFLTNRLPHHSAQRRFNIDGYGLTLIGPDGIVRGVDIRPKEVVKLLGNINVPTDDD